MLTRGNVFIGHLYDGSRTNAHYYYHKGWNVQALVAYIIGIIPPFPGFVGTLGVNVSSGATDLGRLGWILSFTLSFSAYYIICTVWPTRNQRLIYKQNLGWEAMKGDVIFAEDGTRFVQDGKGVVARAQSDSDEPVQDVFVEDEMKS